MFFIKKNNKNINFQKKEELKSYVTIFENKDPQNIAEESFAPKAEQQDEITISSTKENVIKMENTMENEQKNLMEDFMQTVVSAFKKGEPKEENSEIVAIQEKLSQVEASLQEMSSKLSEAEEKLVAKETELGEISQKLQEKEEALNIVEQEKAEKEEEIVKAQYLAQAEEYSELLGTKEEIAQKLRNIDENITDEATKEMVLNSLKSVAQENKASFEEMGSDSNVVDSLSEEEKQEQELYIKAEELSSKEGISIQQALHRLSK